MSLALTRDEVHELSGYIKPGKQIEWLRNNGIRFYVGADGYPRVLRVVIENKPAEKKTEPDVEALRLLTRKNRG